MQGEWLSSGMHINGIGATGTNRRELDVEAIRRSDLVVVENLEQSRNDSGELLFAEREGAFDWSNVTELADIVVGKATGPTLGGSHHAVQRARRRHRGPGRGIHRLPQGHRARHGQRAGDVRACQLGSRVTAKLQRRSNSRKGESP